jgi:hypothetical protein
MKDRRATPHVIPDKRRRVEDRRIYSQLRKLVESKFRGIRTSPVLAWYSNYSAEDYFRDGFRTGIEAQRMREE